MNSLWVRRCLWVRRFTFVCRPCRRSARASYYREPKCVECRGTMQRLPGYLQAPKKDDTKGWETVREVLKTGEGFGPQLIRSFGTKHKPK